MKLDALYEMFSLDFENNMKTLLYYLLNYLE